MPRRRAGDDGRPDSVTSQPTARLLPPVPPEAGPPSRGQMGASVAPWADGRVRAGLGRPGPLARAPRRAGRESRGELGLENALALRPQPLELGRVQAHAEGE